MERDKQHDEIPLPEAALAAGVPYREAWQLVVDGKLPATRRGARWLVRVVDLVRLTDCGADKLTPVGGQGGNRR